MIQKDCSLHDYIHIPIVQTIEDKILKGNATISDIQTACMKYGLLGYSKVNGSNKNNAISELQSIINQ